MDNLLKLNVKNTQQNQTKKYFNINASNWAVNAKKKSENSVNVIHQRNQFVVDICINHLEKCSKFLSKFNENKDTWIMCYPYGSHNEIVIKCLKNFGYRAGLTTVVEDALLTKKNAFTLGRYDTNDFPQ